MKRLLFRLLGWILAFALIVSSCKEDRPIVEPETKQEQQDEQKKKEEEHRKEEERKKKEAEERERQEDEKKRREEEERKKKEAEERERQEDEKKRREEEERKRQEEEERRQQEESKKKFLTLYQLNINTNNKSVKSKKKYVKADIQLLGADKTILLEAKGGIRGRGNSTWVQPKKPYKIKFEEKQSILGLEANKKWVLLANYLDPTLMLTATAMKFGEQLGVPFVNHVIPVELTLNGEYMGQYNLTEQIERGKGRVDISKKGVILELDMNLDDQPKFTSDGYRLPIYIKYPKDEKAKKKLGKIEKKFNALEELLLADDFPNNKYDEKIDVASVVDFLLVFFFTENPEYRHPKSIYMYQEKGQPYKMGPLWDFDWAYGFTGGEHFRYHDTELLDLEGLNKVKKFNKGGHWNSQYFFARILSDPKVKALLKERWQTYRSEGKLDELFEYLDAYNEVQKESRERDYQRWTSKRQKHNDYEVLKAWINRRVAHLDSYINGL